LIVAGRPFLLVGHRGAAAKAPENTASSLRAGLDAGADAVEIDVGLSADGRVVLLHDVTLDRTTSGRGDVGSFSWSELSRLDTGSWFSRRFRSEPFLDLDGALAIARPRASIVVEIKSRGETGEPVPEADVAVARGILSALARTGGLLGATVSSANWTLLERIREEAPLLDLALTVHYRHPGDPVASALAIGASTLHPNRRLCTRAFLDATRGAKLAVIPYTVNRASELRPLLAAGVDGVFSDDPATVRRVLLRLEPPPSPAPPFTLGIDQGSGGTRAVLLDASDGVVASREVPVASRADRAGGVVQDAEAIVASVTAAAAPLLDEAPVPVTGCGIATQRSSLVVWRRSDGKAVSPLLSWRTAGDAALLPSLLAAEPSVVHTTGLTARYPYGAMRIARLLADPDLGPGLRGGKLVAGPVAAFLAARLAARRDGTVDPSLAQRLLLLDLESRRYDPALLSLAGIPLTAVPRVAPSVADRGRIRLGRHRPRLTAIVGDASAAFLAVAGDSGEGAAVVLGTGGFLLVGTGARPVRVPGLLTTLLWEDERGPRYAVEGTVHGLAANLVEVRKRAGLGDLALDLVAARAGPAARTPRVRAAIEGAGTPSWSAESTFEIEDGTWSADEMVAGTLRDVAERFGVIGDLLRERDLAPRRILATGGLASSPHLRGAIAARLGAEVAHDPRPHRTAAGAAMLARRG
jgi:glycerol kinase